MFKEKSTKKRIVSSSNSKDTSTLDAKHQNMIQQLCDSRSQLSVLYNERNTLEQQLHDFELFIKSMQDNDLCDTKEYDIAWTSNLDIRERLKFLDKNIHNLQSCKDEIEYYENTANILFQYYDLIENQTSYKTTQTISMAPVRATKGKKKLLPVAPRSILEALQIQTRVIPTSTIEDQEDSEEIVEASPSASPQMVAPAVTANGVDKSSLVDEYLAAIDRSYVRKKNYDATGVCEDCGASLICLQQDGIMVCSDCGYQELLLVEQNRPILRQPSKEASHFSYKRINHFNSLEWNSRHEMCATC
jgi:hypothetical protein